MVTPNFSHPSHFPPGGTVHGVLEEICQMPSPPLPNRSMAHLRGTSGSLFCLFKPCSTDKEEK